ncbi:exported protein [Nesterenkonia alkaliphila]|nr:exported protein [Nesterenkonia alkaliphila]
MFSENFRQWSEAVEEATEGRVTFEPHYAGSLVPQSGAYEAVEDGTADVVLVAAHALSNRFPEVAFLEGIGAFPPHVFDDYEPFYDEATEAFESVFADVELLTWGPSSQDWVFAHRTHHLVQPDDFSGQLVRTTGPVQGDQLTALGASPTTIDPADLYVSLQTGQVDGSITTPPLLVSLNVLEVAPYVTHVNAGANPIFWLANSDSWDQISQEDQEAAAEALREVGISTPEMFSELEQEAWEAIENDPGADVLTLDEEQMELLLTEIVPVVENEADNAAERSEAGAELAEIFSGESE